HEGQLHLVLDALQLELHLLAQLQVERPERLVEEQYARAVDERARERDTLLLPARELARLAAAVAGEPDDAQHLLDPALQVGALHALAPQAEGDVLEDRQVREERVALEDGVDVALVRRQPGDRSVAEEDRPLRRLLEAADHAQGRRLPAARRPEEGVELPALDLEVQVVDGDDVVEALRDSFEPHVRGHALSRASSTWVPQANTCFASCRYRNV